MCGYLLGALVIVILCWTIYGLYAWMYSFEEQEYYRRHHDVDKGES